ncbi:hypothetical protein [Priestia megaterium]|uniref:Uncharacterized protein n=1 Tax=Priestia megaterium TaxID=1404 RepID=A0A6M6E035_PRIMG|nr:hypothetical protein [Priestia megaterium]QJX80362.1 hypothetical protein FDZ14_30205 [Priestia megaterium]
MKFRDLMQFDNFLFLIDIKEFGPLELEITLEFMDSPNSKEETITRKIVFESYVAFEVIAEHFDRVDEKEIFSGKLIRIYKESNYLNYIRSITYAEEIHPESPLVHYQFVCEDHIINVISLEEKPHIIS